MTETERNQVLFDAQLYNTWAKVHVCGLVARDRGDEGTAFVLDEAANAIVAAAKRICDLETGSHAYPPP